MTCKEGQRSKCLQGGIGILTEQRANHWRSAAWAVSATQLRQRIALKAPIRDQPVEKAIHQPGVAEEHTLR
ncbi:hypothetical protein Tamer19_73620 [Cupriavidus sp. TA19]|nr:hypothetical protein Tamer19_73620 [Cupriavidus sp. TA19]